ncbi:MAG: hypothetical protein MI975_09545 [Cytophagales bacterium]|nr:hypothetical protein [Cytophagales bacterium]
MTLSTNQGVSCPDQSPCFLTWEVSILHLPQEEASKAIEIGAVKMASCPCHSRPLGPVKKAAIGREHIEKLFVPMHGR